MSRPKAHLHPKLDARSLSQLGHLAFAFRSDWGHWDSSSNTAIATINFLVKHLPRNLDCAYTLWRSVHLDHASRPRGKLLVIFSAKLPQLQGRLFDPAYIFIHLHFDSCLLAHQWDFLDLGTRALLRAIFHRLWTHQHCFALALSADQHNLYSCVRLRTSNPCSRDLP